MKSYFSYFSFREKYFTNYLKYAKILKKYSKKIFKDPELKLIVFGSVIENDFTLSSDIDVLIISKKSPRKGLKRAKVLSKIYNSLGEPNPFEIHLITPSDWRKWYSHFVEKFVEV
ncbi:MAG: nucleotidyltransferase domain-containing protein [Candidatus Aenigmatarchaeota archaeon]